MCHPPLRDSQERQCLILEFVTLSRCSVHITTSCLFGLVRSDSLFNCPFVSKQHSSTEFKAGGLFEQDVPDTLGVVPLRFVFPKEKSVVQQLRTEPTQTNPRLRQK
jgi:hypothetical protein